MFRKMRLAKKELPQDKTWQVLEKAEYGVLSVLGDDGYPYGVPVQFVVINDAIYIHCAKQGHKLDAIAAEPKVCFTAVSDMQILAEDFNTAFHSAVAFGKAALLEDEQENLAVLWKIFEKYTPENLKAAKDYLAANIAETAVIKITIDHLTGKAKEV